MRRMILLSILLHAVCMRGNDAPAAMDAGVWFRIAVERDGIYGLTYDELRHIGVDDPANVRLYGTGGAMLPEVPDRNDINTLREIPVWLDTGSDGVFNAGDRMLFYGQGPAVWQYDAETETFAHAVHLWDTKSYYFITSAAGGKRIAVENRPAAAPSQQVTSFDEHVYYEREYNYLQKSGRNWYGEAFSSVTSHTFPFSVPDMDTGEPAYLDISFMASTVSAAAQLHVFCNGTQTAAEPLPAITENYQRAVPITFRTSAFYMSQDALSVKLSLEKNATNASGWLDWIRLHARRRLHIPPQKQLFFRDTRSAGAGQVSAFRITGGSATTQVWDVTDMHRIRQMETSLAGDVLSFSAATDSLREFAVFDAVTGVLQPGFPDGSSRMEPQNLHAITDADMVIVTHPDFIGEARALAALHREKDGLNVETVTDRQVYNEFSSGMQDPAAIRNFMKYLYEKSASAKLKYLLLMGDGSFDNKSNRISAAMNTNYIVTYQSANSWHQTESYVSDDYFGIVGDGETVETGTLAIGTGRLPVQTAEQARNIVAKISQYMTDAAQAGDWPNSIGLLSDDGDGHLHALQSETIAEDIRMHHPQHTVEKLYLDAFPRVATADGHRYPEVEQQLNNLLHRGCLLVNYTGHGNPSGLAEERVVNTTGIGQWKNRIYPVFVAATCEFGRYDNDAVMSAGEMMLLGAKSGSIATLTSTRLVYSSLNFDFNRSFVGELLARPAAGSDADFRLGDIFRRAKNSSVSSINKLCFALLGDPALKPAVPALSVKTVAVNGTPVNEPLDTLKANSRVTVTGSIVTAGGNPCDWFNGTVHFSLFDKARERETLNHSGDAVPMTFSVQTSVLYRGTAAVKNGVFELSFIMPREINYQYGFGKMSYYACSGDGATAAGSFADIVTGGAVPGSGNMEGPEIRLFMNDTLFRDGGITDQNPRLIVLLRDSDGINTSDWGIGHDITAVLNSAPSAVYNLNRYYVAGSSGSGGTVTYQFTGLPEGNCSLLFTAWDTENNPSQASLRFRVTRSSVLQIDRLYNYPNPFTDDTHIYFECNMPDTELQAELQIYDMAGRLLRSMRQAFLSGGYTSGQFAWDGRDAGGNHMEPGIYPYRVILRTEKGETAVQTSKLMIVK